MTPTIQPRNLAAGAGRWSARHWKTAALAWVAFVVAAAVAGGAAGTRELTDPQEMNGDSAAAQRIIDEARFRGGGTEAILVQNPSATVTDAAFREVVRDIVDSVEALPAVRSVDSPYAPGHDDLLAGDGHAAVIAVNLAGRTAEPYDGVGQVLDAIDAAQHAHPGFQIGETGDDSMDKALDETVGRDFHNAELSAIPISLVILLFAFGAVVAALLPVALALSAFIAAQGLLAFASRAAPVDDATTSVMLLIGLAVGVDYSLFYLKRVREERSAGHRGNAAIEAAAATSGRAVLVSGITVVVAMAGMLLSGNRTFVGIAVGTVIAVLTAMLASLTVLPALLARLGDNVERGKIPGLARVRTGDRSRAWSAVLGVVLRRPLAAAFAGVALLLAMAAPALGLRTADLGAGDLPQDLSPVQTLTQLEHEFPGQPSAAEVVARAADVTSREMRGAVRDFEHRAVAEGASHPPFETAVNPAGTVAVISAPLPGDGIGDSRSESAVMQLRALADETLRPAASEVAVGGDTAASMDFNSALRSHAPLVFAFVLGLALLLLLTAFRSPVIAVTAVVLNLLSVAAAYGLLVLVFQHGVGESLLDFHSTGTVVTWLPLFMFVVLFGLSMDYHVFIVSRIRELRLSGVSTREAIAGGVTSTAGAVTAAAVVMVCVFAVFGTLSQLSLKQLGVGLAAAVLIDATVVRAVLLPAVMALLGEANWIGVRRHAPRTRSPVPAREHAPAQQPIGAAVAQRSE